MSIIAIKIMKMHVVGIGEQPLLFNKFLAVFMPYKFYGGTK